MADLDNLPDPEDLAADIIENLEAGLESFREIMVSDGQRTLQLPHAGRSKPRPKLPIGLEAGIIHDPSIFA